MKKEKMLVSQGLMLVIILSLVACTNYDSIASSSKTNLFSGLSINTKADIIISEKKYEFAGLELDAYTYNGVVPGPLLEAVKGETKSFTFFNDLEVDTSVHFHGIIPQNSNDGVPLITQDPIRSKENYVYELKFPNSGLFWYHSHVEGYEQVERGLQAPFIVHEKDLVVAKENEIVYVVDDILVRNNEWYPFSTSFMHGRNGNVLMVNGEKFDKSHVDSNVARLRIVNTANARNAIISFGDKEGLVIGKDLEFGKPYKTNSVFIPPAGRVDVILYGDKDSPTYISRKIGSDSHPMAEITYAGTPVEINLPDYEDFAALREEFNSLQVHDTISMIGVMKHMRGVEWTFNNKAYPDDPLTYELSTGKYVFEIENTQGQPHPIHFHGLKFMVLERNGESVDDNFWYDTVYVGNREKVKLGLVLEEKGSWVFHCHILEHADSGMLGLLEVK